MTKLSTIAAELKPKKKVLILGSAFVDVLIKTPCMPVSGGDLRGDFQAAKVGGCSFNAADVLAKLHLPFDALLPIGEGMMADLVRTEFARRHYPCQCFSGYGDNGWCLTLIEPSGERTFITMPGLETRFNLAWFDNVPLENYDLIYLSGYQTEGDNAQVILQALQRVRKDALIVYDPGPRTPYLDASVLRALEDLPLMHALNAAEAMHLSTASDAKTAALTLHARTGHPAIVTCGAQGALIAQDENCVQVPGFAIELADTVGSGDAHSGGLIAGLMCDLPLADAVLLANATAACVSARPGPACCPELDEFLHFAATADYRQTAK